MIRKFDAHFARLLAALALLGALLVLAMVAAVTADVVLRGTTGRGFPVSNEVSEYGVYLVTLLASPWLLRHGMHVKVDILSSRVKGRAGRALEWFIDVTGAAVFAVIAFYGFMMVAESVQSGSMVIKNVVFPEWIALLPLPLAFVLLTVECLLGLVHAPEPPDGVLP